MPGRTMRRARRERWGWIATAAVILAAGLYAFSGSAARADSTRAPGDSTVAPNPAVPAGHRQVVLFVIDDFTGKDAHGANVRSILARASARRVEIQAIDVGATLDRAKYFQGIQVIQRWVKAHPGSAAVVNLSFGSYQPDEREELLLRELARDGAVIVAAAGNDGTDITFYPAGYKCVLAVGALDDAGNIAAYSNFGAHVALYAPGRLRDDVITNRLIVKSPGVVEREFVYRFIGGTSFAAPQVAGLLAYLLHQREGLTLDDAVDLLEDTSRIVPVRPGRPPVRALDAGRVLAREDAFYRHILAARSWLYGVLGAAFFVCLVYSRGPGVALALGTFLWAGVVWTVARPVIGRLGVVNGTLTVHVAAAAGALGLIVWSFLGARRDRRRERELREAREREMELASRLYWYQTPPPEPPPEGPPGDDRP